jgi:hypothetical protein
MRARQILPPMLLALLIAVTANAGPKSQVTPSSASNPARALAPPVNDQCSGAILLQCGNIVLSGNTTDANNDYAFVDTAGSCTGYATNGRDVVYKLNVGVGDSLWLDYQNRVDGSIYLVTNCSDIDHTCVAGSDDNSDPNTIESIRYRFTASGIYYLILDSYGINSGDLWTASGQLVCGPQTPPSNDLCENATVLPCGSFNLSGSTEFAHNNYNLGFPNPCTPKPSAGRDVVYKLYITAGDSLWCYYTNQQHDGSIYVVADCNNPAGSCIWGEDFNGVGDLEPFRYKFQFSGTYYLVLDAVEADSWSPWTAFGALVCANPPPENDHCAEAIEQPCNTNFNWSGSTHFANNDYFFGGSSACTGFPADGRDVAYKFAAHVGDTLTVNYRSISSDASMYLVTDCANVNPTCVAGVDNTYTGEYETLTYIFPSGGWYYLILDSVDFNSWSAWTAYGRFGCGLNAVDPSEPALSLALREISPNPSFGRTNIFYQLPTRGRATLRIFDLQGRVMRTLVDAEQPAGQQHVIWDGRDDHGQSLTAGIYFARLSSGAAGAVRRVIFVR